MDKKQQTEVNIRTKFITPALVGGSATKWNAMTQMREEVFFTKGRVIVRHISNATYRRTEMILHRTNHILLNTRIHMP